MNARDPFQDYFYLGKIIRTHGFDGKVNAYLDTDEPDLYIDLEMVYLNISGTPVPYFIEDIQVLNNKATIRFHDVTDLEGASFLVQKEIYLPDTELPELSGNKFYYHEVKGFLLIDKAFGEVGIVKDVLEYPNQAVFQVIREGKEVLVPISDEVITKVDRDKREIHVATPEGLIGIYL